MNVVQILRKARLGCDAILPGGTASSLWATDELIDLTTQANDELNMRLRLVRKKWGLVTLNIDSADIVRDGETYVPSDELATLAGATEVRLPPDFAEMSKILCTNLTSMRFQPAEFESQYWVEAEQGSREEDGTFLNSGTGFGATYFYDLVAERTLALTPPLADALDLSISYVPMKRPLYYSTTGTISVTNGSVVVNGDGTTWSSDNVFAEDDHQGCELIVGISSLSSTSVRLDKDYPRVARIGSNAQLELVSAYPGVTATAQTFIVAMVPTLPRVYHRWIAELTSAFMLRKVNPELADKYAISLLGRFDTTIQPTAGARQSQESLVTDDDESFGGLSE